MKKLNEDTSGRERLAAAAAAPLALAVTLHVLRGRLFLVGGLRGVEGVREKRHSCEGTSIFSNSVSFKKNYFEEKKS